MSEKSHPAEAGMKTGVAVPKYCSTASDKYLSISTPSALGIVLCVRDILVGFGAMKPIAPSDAWLATKWGAQFL
jgi:hypothetical protein